jgi:lysyl-tRNA synthetase class 1
MSENRAQHWADAIAQEVLQDQSQHLISTGITPSGDYHVGHLREVMTAEGVHRALLDQGAEVRFNYIADTMDPLRRVYDFLDPEVYTDAVGKPLCDIPCPCGDHASYAAHFLISPSSSSRSPAAPSEPDCKLLTTSTAGTR